MGQKGRDDKKKRMGTYRNFCDKKNQKIDI